MVPIENKEVSYSEVKKGYEISKDNYITIEKNGLYDIKLKTTKTIDIKEFIESKELGPILIGIFLCSTGRKTWCTQ